MLGGLIARLRNNQARVVPAASTKAEREDALSSSGPELTETPSTVFPERDAPGREFPLFVGESPALLRMLARVESVLDNDLPVLVCGETGSGKELVARSIHEHGRRANKPFVAINCGAIADSLFEAELFGHARGSFTGADRARAGLMAQAEGGTLFMDEIGELPVARQATLLRVLETRRYRSVGGDDERPFNVRIVTATNRNLEDLVDKGTFRQDLYFRIKVLEIRVPALRDRQSDIPLLIEHFRKEASTDVSFSKPAISALTDYSWPGNIRELAHAVQKLCTRGLKRIDVEHLPREIRRMSGNVVPLKSHSQQDAEKTAVLKALKRARGNITHAAEHLGITRHGLKKRMLRLGLRQSATDATNPTNATKEG